MLGPSGSGKTTCLRLIAGFEQPDGRPYRDLRRDGEGIPPYRRNVNTVFQDYALFPHLNVVDNVAYGLMVKGVGRRSAAVRRRRRWRWCGSPVTATGGQASFRAGSASAWRWHARWSTVRACCFSTSRSALST